MVKMTDQNLEKFSPALKKLWEAARAVEDSREIYETNLELRNRLIISAVDRGFDQSELSKICKIGRPAIIKILLKGEQWRNGSPNQDLKP